MLATRSIDVRDNFKAWCDKVTAGESVLVIRPKSENVYLISEKEYNELLKAKRNEEYLRKLVDSAESIKQGNTITFTMEELREMEKEDWKPSQRILDFEKRNGIKRG